MPLVKSHKIEFSHIDELPKPRVNDNGGKTIYINYRKGMFRMQTPVMTMPYNMGCYDKGDYPKYSLDVAFRDLDSDSKVKAFHDNMNKLEQFILESALKNSKDWFSKTHKSLDVLRALFTPLIKKSIDKETGEPDGKYADTIKFKLPVRDGKPKFKIIDFQDQVIENPDLKSLFTKESKVQVIARCGGIWVIAGKFGCTWTVEEVRVESNMDSSSGGKISFINDDDDSQAEESSSDEEVEDTSDEEDD